MKKTSHFSWEFETITKHTLDIILIVDKNQIVQFATPSFQTVLGYTPEEVIGKNAFDPLFPEDRDYLMASHKEVILTGQPKTDEYRVVHKNGEIKYFESRVMPVPNHPDQLIVVSIRDVTKRKNMEAELQRRKNRYEELQNSLKNYSQDLSTVINVIDLENRLIKELRLMIPECEPKIHIINRKNSTIEDNPANLLFDFQSSPTKLIIGKPQYENEQIHILIGDRKEQAYILTLKESSIKESMDTIWLETLIYYTVMVFESLNVIQDLMKQLEFTLHRSERPQWILRLLFNLSEKQRLELSSDLHDTVLQDQIQLYRNLEAILKEYDFDREIDVQLKGIVQGLLDTIHQIRRTCNELRPPLLKEMGLERALEDLFDYTQVTSTYKIMYSTENITDLILSEEQTISIYRIVQELLNNATKHSHATNVHFYMVKVDHLLKIEYFDNGKGLETDKLTPSFTSMGLSGMRERVQSLDGSIEFHSQLGKGLTVNIQIPTDI